MKITHIDLRSESIQFEEIAKDSKFFAPEEFIQRFSIYGEVRQSF